MKYSFRAGGKTYSSSFDEDRAEAVMRDGYVEYTATRVFPCGITAREEWRVYGGFPAAELLVSLVNTSDRDTEPVEKLSTACSLPGFCGAVLKYGNGDTCRSDGYSFFSLELEDSFSLSPISGTSCQGAFPYFELSSGGAAARIAVGWPGRWLAEFNPGDDGSLSFVCSQKRLSAVLHPGEELRSPRLTLMLYDNRGPYFGINLWRRWYIRHILPHPYGKPVPPMLCLHNFRAGGFPEFTGADEENQLTALKRYIDRGLRPDVWWIDAGWYPCDHEWQRTGSWKYDSERFPRGLRPIGEFCEENGIRLLLWFEPERVRSGSDIDRDHPEWLLHRTLPDGTDSRNRLLDLGNPEALERITDTVDSVIKESRVGVYRQDFNFDPAPYWEQNESPDRIGFAENAHIRGYLAFWDELRRRNPGLLIDSCASGGRRNDLETMRRAVTLHYTDVGYGNHPIKQKQHREMFEWIPYFRAHNMNWYDPSGGEYGGAEHTPDAFSYMNAMTPSVTMMIKHDDPEELFAEARNFAALWRRASEYLTSFDYYPVSGGDGDPAGTTVSVFLDPSSGRGMVHVIRNYRSAHSDGIAIPAGVFPPNATLVIEKPSMTIAAGADGRCFLPLPGDPGSSDIYFLTIKGR
ncbi:MAG: alpha-galactosidase [Clostridia bacterium]|nr:alpha-galactosidase [Clostridia bacterium]